MNSINMPHGRLSDVRNMRMLFMMCMVAYITTYLGRLDYAACLVEIVEAEGWTKSGAGLIATGFFATYGIGQLVNGYIGDRISPKIMVACGLGFSGIVNILFPFTDNTASATALWCLNGFIQSMIWSPIIRLLSEWMPENRRLRSCVNMNAAVPLGTLCTYGLSAALVYLVSWKAVFFTSGVILVIVCMIWLITVSRMECRLEPVQIIVKEEHVEIVKQSSMWKIALMSALPICCAAVFMQGMLKDGITLWIPTFLSENFGLVSAAAILSTTVVPIVNLGGVYFASWMNHRFFKNEVTSAMILFMTSAIALVLLSLFMNSSAIASLVLLATATTCMMGINTLLASMMPSYFVRFGVCSTATGILNSSAYAGCAISSYGNGAIVESMGWGAVMRIWCIIAIAGVIISALAFRRWGKFRELSNSMVSEEI